MKKYTNAWLVLKIEECLKSIESAINRERKASQIDYCCLSPSCQSHALSKDFSSYIQVSIVCVVLFCWVF